MIIKVDCQIALWANAGVRLSAPGYNYKYQSLRTCNWLLLAFCKRSQWPCEIHHHVRTNWLMKTLYVCHAHEWLINISYVLELICICSWACVHNHGTWHEHVHVACDTRGIMHTIVLRNTCAQTDEHIICLPCSWTYHMLREPNQLANISAEQTESTNITFRPACVGWCGREMSWDVVRCREMSWDVMMTNEEG